MRADAGTGPEVAEIRISGDDEIGELSALRDWLRHQRGLEGAVEAVRRPLGETELGGGAVELLAVALGSGGAGATLAKSLIAWLRNRRSDVKITVTSPSGSVVIEAHRVSEAVVMPLLRQVLGAVRDDS